MGNFSQEDLLQFLYFFPVLLISVALHEFAHCWTDDRLGDDTPRRHGRVTLNPFKHLDSLGTIMMVVSAFAHFGIGWGKPSPFNPNNFRHPVRDRMIGALAGPFSNILQMIAWASLLPICIFFFPVVDPNNLPLPIEFCFTGIGINAALATFNLLPVYPLDGHHILSYLAPRSWRPIIDNPAWAYVFLAIVLIGPIRQAVLSPILGPAREWLTHAALLLVGISTS